MSEGLLLVYALILAVGAYLLVAFTRQLSSRDVKVLAAINISIIMAMAGLRITNFWVYVFVLFMINFAARVLLFHTSEKELGVLEDQLANALLVISGALKAGRSLEQGFALVERGMPAPIADEFHRVRRDLEMGKSFEEALKEFMRRTPSKDYKLFLTATLFQRRTGGNLIALYDQITFAVSERRRLKGRLDNMTLQGRYTGYIMMSLPLIFCGFLFAMNPQRFLALTHQEHGLELFFVSFVWLSIGVIWLWNIVNHKIG